MEKVGIAVLGGGYWGKNLIRNFGALEEGEVRMVCDLNEQVLMELKETFPLLPVTSDLQRILEEDRIQGVAVATPPSLHYGAAKRALVAKKHTWVEKPLSMVVTEGEELVRLAKDQGLVLFVDETFLYDPALTLVKEVVGSGEVGEICHVLFQRLGMGRIRCDSNVWWNSAPHDLSILLYLLPVPVNNISLRCFSYLQNGIEDVAWASLEMGEGISACVNLSWFYPQSTASVTIIGKQGAIHYEGRFNARKVSIYNYTLGSAPTFSVNGVPSPNFIPIGAKLKQEITDFGQRTPLELACQHFLHCIKEDKEPISSGRNSLKVLRLLQAGEQSKNQAGEMVRL